MKRIAILTAGGDTPALNATLHGAVQKASELGIELLGIIEGFSGILDPNLPHVRLNPLYAPIPELDPCIGGTILGASRTYVDDSNADELTRAAERLSRLKIDGLICIGGDGTINGMQPLSEFLPCVLAPKTIDNDLGLNHIDEPNEWVCSESESGEMTCKRGSIRESIDLEEMINYVTPGFATAVYVAAQGLGRIRTTAESHRRIAIVEVMGRDSGYIALGSAYGQPDLILIPEAPLDRQRLFDRVRQLYDLQKNVVIVVGEGVIDEDGQQLGATHSSVDPAGNVIFSGAAERLADLIATEFGDAYFQNHSPHTSATRAVFTRKVGHTQRGGRPIRFDRFQAAQLGGHAVELLQSGRNNYVATIQYESRNGLTLSELPAGKLRDPWGNIRARQVHPSFYDVKQFQPSEQGRQYLNSIFEHAVGQEDLEVIRASLFSQGNLITRHQSFNVDIQKRIRHLD